MFKAFKNLINKITFQTAFIFVVSLDISFLLIKEDGMGNWFILIGIAAGVLLGWIYSLKMWFNDDSPWQPPKQIFKDDPKIINTAILVSFSKGKAILGCLLGIGLIVFSIITFLQFSDLAKDEIPYGYISSSNLFLFGLRLIYKKGRELYNNNPQLIITDKGLETPEIGFYSWSQINKLQIVDTTNYLFFNNYIIFYYPSGRMKLDVTDYDTNIFKLSHLLEVFQARYEQNNN